MNIYLEGNEANFKTTVAQKLSNKLGWEIVKGSSFELSMKPNEELYDYFLKLSLLENKIVDRFIYSNLTYASLYNDFSIINEDQKKVIESIMNRDNSIVIHLYADEQTLRQRLLERGDDYVVPERLGEINNKITEVMSKADVRLLSFNTAEMSSDEIVEEVLKHID